jgi:hypothetical protein
MVLFDQSMKVQELTLEITVTQTSFPCPSSLSPVKNYRRAKRLHQGMEIIRLSLYMDFLNLRSREFFNNLKSLISSPLLLVACV